MQFTEPQQLLGIWVAALLSLVIFSFLYKDNPFYKVAEHLFLGVALGYSLSLQYWENFFPKGIAPLFYTEGAPPNYWIVIPLVLGLFVLLRLIPALSWLSRYAFAVYIGTAMGVLIPTVMAGNVLPQLVDTMQPLWTPDPALTGFGLAWSIITRLLILVGVFATLLYFFYSMEHRGVAGKVSRVGVFFIMLGFGASFGNTVMARVSLLIGRFIFLLDDWWTRAVLPLFGIGG